MSVALEEHPRAVLGDLWGLAQVCTDTMAGHKVQGGLIALLA